MALADLLTGGTAELQRLLAEHGILFFAGVQVTRGMLLLILIPDEAITPLFVLLYANNVFDVAFISVVAAAAILAGNFIMYLFIRVIKLWLLGGKDSIEHRSRILHWAVDKHPKASMLFMRMIPGFGDWAMIPAALVRMPIGIFLIYSFIGLLIYESLLGFGTFYGIKEGLFFQTEIGQQVFSTVNQTAQGQELLGTLEELRHSSP